MEITKVEKDQTVVRKVREKAISNISKEQQEQLNTYLQSTEEQSPEIESMANLDYPIIYEPLCSGKINGIPLKLHYKPIDGFMLAKINELNLETIDDGIHYVLDSLCFEAKQGFNHWLMPTDEKVRAYLNLRLNTAGNMIEHLFGICTECGKEKLFIKVQIDKFDSVEIKEEYKEPFPLKVKIKNNEVKFQCRLIQSGDIYKAKNVYKKDKGLVHKMFELATDKEESIVIQILEYANSILSINEQKVTFEAAIEFCKNNIGVMNAITSFNDYFYYGIQLKTNGDCDNKECPSYELNEKTGKSISRGCQFRIPLQPNFFYITHSEKEAAKQYFDL